MITIRTLAFTLLATLLAVVYPVAYAVPTPQDPVQVVSPESMSTRYAAPVKIVLAVDETAQLDTLRVKLNNKDITSLLSLVGSELRAWVSWGDGLVAGIEGGGGPADGLNILKTRVRGSAIKGQDRDAHNFHVTLPAVAENIQVDPVHWDYGQVEVGAFVPMSLTITSIGPDIPLRVDRIMIVDDDTGSYEVASIAPEITFPHYLPVGETLEVVVNFAPSAEGKANGTLYVLSNAHNGMPLFIPFQGQGIYNETTPVEMDVDNPGEPCFDDKTCVGGSACNVETMYCAINPSICDAFTDRAYLEVTWFGVSGDEVENATQAIRDALFCLDDGPSSELVFPVLNGHKGRYRVTSPIAITKPVLITGYVGKTGATRIGGKKPIKRKATVLFDFPVTETTGKLFNILSDGVHIRSLDFDGGLLASSSDMPNRYAVFVNNSNNVTIRGCSFQDLLAEDSPAQNNGRVTHGVYVSGSDNTVVEDCDFHEISGAAIFVTRSNNTRIQHNDIHNTGWYSIHFHQQCDGAEILGNSITGDDVQARNYGGSIDIMSLVDSALPSETFRNSNILVQGNHISGVHSYTSVVRVLSASNVIIKDNRIEGIVDDEDGNDEYSYYILVDSRWGFVEGGWKSAGPSDNIVVTNNHLIAGDASAVGILLRNSSPVTEPEIGYAHDIAVTNNRIESLKNKDAYFTHGVFAHGHNQGLRDIEITDNEIDGRWGQGTSVGGVGLVGVVALPHKPLTGVTIQGNRIYRIYKGNPSIDSPDTNDRGIVIGQFCDEVYSGSDDPVLHPDLRNEMAYQYIAVSIDDDAGENIYYEHNNLFVEDTNNYNVRDFR